MYREREFKIINTKVEYDYKFQNNTEEYILQKIKHLPETQYFRRGSIYRF